MTVFDRMLQNLKDRLTKPVDKKLNEDAGGIKHYSFTITINGNGMNADEAWKDAVEGFTHDPGWAAAPGDAEEIDESKVNEDTMKREDFDVEKIGQVTAYALFRKLPKDALSDEEKEQVDKKVAEYIKKYIGEEK